MTEFGIFLAIVAACLVGIALSAETPYSLASERHGEVAIIDHALTQSDCAALLGHLQPLTDARLFCEMEFRL